MKQLIIFVFLICSINLYSQEIFTAYENKDYKKIEELLEKGADPNQLKESNGLTLMFDAAWDNNIRVIKLLHKYGGEVDIKCGVHDLTPILPACQENAYEALIFIELRY